MLFNLIVKPWCLSIFSNILGCMWWSKVKVCILNHYPRVTYGDMDLGQQWSRLWLGIWLYHQTISWPSVDLRTLAFIPDQFAQANYLKQSKSMHLKSLPPCNVWWHGSWSAMVQVMAWYLTVPPSHDLAQCWLENIGIHPGPICAGKLYKAK